MRTKLLLFFTVLTCLLNTARVHAQFYTIFEKQSAYEANLLKKNALKKKIVKDLLSKSGSTKVAEFKYNENGQVVKRETDQDEQKTETQYKYHPSGTLKSVEYLEKYDGASVSYKIEYGTNGIPTAASWMMDRFGTKTKMKILFEYRAAERLLLGYEMKEGETETLYKTKTWYTNDNKVREWVRTDSKNDTLGWGRTTYDAMGMPATETLFGQMVIADKEKFTEYDSTVINYTRNESGTVIKEIREQYRVSCKTRKAEKRYWPICEIEYNENGQMLKTTDYKLDDDGMKQIPTMTQTQTYNDLGLPEVNNLSSEHDLLHALKATYSK